MTRESPFGLVAGAVHISLGQRTEHLCDHLYMLGDLHLFFDFKVLEVPLEPVLLTIVVTVPISRGKTVVCVV